MKITAYSERFSVDLSSSAGIIAANYARTSIGSNTPKIESGSGSPGSGPQAAAWDHVHPEFGGASSFGSNSTRVSSSPAAGASSSNSRADHVHDGIGTVTASSSNTLNRGTVNLRAGTDIAFALSNTDGGSGFDTVTIQSLASGGGGGSVSYGSNSTRVSSVPSAGILTAVSRADHVHDGVRSVAKAGSAALVGDVTLTGGTNVTLTQSGQDISIAASGSGSSIPDQSIPYPTSASGDDDLMTSTAGWSDVGANAYSTFSSDGHTLTLIALGASKTSTIRKTLGTTKSGVFDFRFGLMPLVDWWSTTNDTNFTVYLRTSGGSQIAAMQFQVQQISLPTPRSNGIAAAGSGAFTLSAAPAVPIGTPLVIRITRDGSNVIRFYYALTATPFDLSPLPQPGSGTYRAPLTFTVSGTVERIEVTTVTPAGPPAAAENGGKLDFFVSA